MDVQLVNGEEDLAYYVMKYALKAEPDDLKKALCNQLEKMQNDTGLSDAGRMFKLGMTVLKTRTLSAQEAAVRIIGLPYILILLDQSKRSQLCALKSE